jgi:hypothetical protein
LQPYRCIVPSCIFNNHPFTEKKLLVEHLELEHVFGESWAKICGICRRDAGDSMTSAAFHLAHHLEEVSLMILPPNAGDQGDEESLDIKETESLGDSINSGEFQLANILSPILKGPQYANWESLTAAKWESSTEVNVNAATAEELAQGDFLLVSSTHFHAL